MDQAWMADGVRQLLRRLPDGCGKIGMDSYPL